MSELILPEHIKRQQEKQRQDEENKKWDEEEKAQQEAADRGDNINVNMMVSPMAPPNDDRFAVIVMYEGFVTQKSAEQFAASQAAAMRGNRKERRAKESIEAKHKKG